MHIIRRAIPIVLVTALASLAAGAPKKKGGKTTPAKTTEPKPAEPDAPKPADASADADAKPAGGGGTTVPATPGAGTGSGSATAPTGPGAGAGSGKPAKDAEPKVVEPDVDALRQEYLALRDELFKSSARAGAVASQLYSTRITIRLTWASPRYYGVTKSSIRLDGAIAGDDGVRFDGYVAPGRHLVTFHVEASGKDDDSFTSTTEAQIVVKAVAGKDLQVAAKARDGGDIAYEWKKKERGSYGLAIDVAVLAAPPGGGGEQKASKGKK